MGNHRDNVHAVTITCKEWFLPRFSGNSEADASELPENLWRTVSSKWELYSLVYDPHYTINNEWMKNRLSLFTQTCVNTQGRSYIEA